jgi:hypothetical protein
MAEKVLFIATILVIAIMAGAGAVILMTIPSDTESPSAWLNEKHTCPNCHWNGYPGAMRIEHQGTDNYQTLYFCPDCGYLFKKINGTT